MMAERCLQKMDEAKLREKRDEIVALCVEASPKIVEALIEKAVGGNVRAAQMVLQVAGLLAQRGQSQVALVNNTQLVLSESERLELLEAWKDAVADERSDF
ncbi:hypothetical protein GFC01_14170 [Desulfofundulus thermobenzoicus]|uniref:Uncharacterized protein n=1 Tax=Desulfofundulus thermobenzoicus TaxID=29376 RepID=A0A6N7IV15_9FIRM|nr:hypothetical protein [Desulfofundulus thermobenzoicus]MQL53383.1 hypothetical protein [Desulfofundulus thermobenzoicus]